MKKIALTIFILIFAGNLYSQNKWNLVWSLHQKPFQDPQVGSEMAIVKAGFDTDQDGYGEFLCAYTDLAENYILMYEAVSDNNYELVWSWKYPVQANSFAGIAVGDADNNGTVEIITSMPSIANSSDPNPPRLWVFEWNGVVGENKYGDYSSGECEPTNSWNFGFEDNADVRPYSLNIEDIDNDGMNELIAGMRQGDRGREVIVATVSGEFSGFGAWQIEYNLQGLTGGSLYSVTTGDLDNDGNKEIYAFIWNMFSLHIIECTGHMQYDVVNSLTELYTDQGIDYGALDAVRVADVNNDGVNELYIAGTEPQNTLFIITGVSDVSKITADDVKAFYTIPPQAGGKFRSMWIADPDKDGNMDLMIGGELNGQIYDLEYKGSGDPADSANWNLYIAFDMFKYSGFSPDSTPTIDPRLFYGCPAKDMDKDGLDEYVFVNYRSSFDVWEGDGYVWVLEIDENATGVENGTSFIPKTVKLSQNYPNPFNPETNIKFSLNEMQPVKLIVYDMLGRQVEILLNREMPAGDHVCRFDAGKYSAGVYYYTLTAGNRTETKKMILMK